MLNFTCEKLQCEFCFCLTQKFRESGLCIITFPLFLQAFCQAYVVRAFIETVQSAQLQPSLKAVMSQLCQLFAVQGILKFSGQFTKVRSLRK